MKYLHFVVDQFYSKEFIELVQSNFNTEDHLFIIIKQKNEKFYINPENYLNIKVFTYYGNFLINFLTNNYIKIRKIMKQAEFIFIHYLTEKLSRILFRFKGKAKILWIIWGSDLYKYIPLKLHDKHTSELLSKLDGKVKSLFKRISTSFYNEIRKAVIKRFDYIITANRGDVRLFRKYFKNKARWYPYDIYPNPIDIEEIYRGTRNSDNERILRKNKKDFFLLIGNSGAPTNNHLDILIRLSKLKEQNFKIVCPLSYGTFKYINKIIKEGKIIFGNRFIPLTQFLKPERYFKILEAIDLAIMYHNRQQGRGTINILFQLGIPICMKKTSLFFYYQENNISVFSTENLENIISKNLEFNLNMSLNKIKNKSLFNQGISTISSIKTLLYLLEEKDN